MKTVNFTKKQKLAFVLCVILSLVFVLARLLTADAQLILPSIAPYEAEPNVFYTTLAAIGEIFVCACLGLFFTKGHFVGLIIGVNVGAIFGYVMTPSIMPLWVPVGCLVLDAVLFITSRSVS